MNPQLIPPLDAAGLPGPPWLFHVLLVFTFFLHMLFMNLTLGGTLLAAVAHFRGGGRRDDPRGALAGRLMAETLGFFERGAVPREPQDRTQGETLPVIPEELLRKGKHRLADGSYSHFAEW